MEAAGRTYPGFFIDINCLRLNPSNEKEHDTILMRDLSLKFHYTVLPFDDNNLLPR
jgi:hypothetical protein